MAATALSGQLPKYIGSTGGLLNSAETEEKYAITWTSPKEQVLFKPRIEDYKIYRIFPGGDTEFLHPKDGVFPEKVNEGRAMVGHNPRRIGANPNPANLKFTGKNTFDA